MPGNVTVSPKGFSQRIQDGRMRGRLVDGPVTVSAFDFAVPRLFPTVWMYNPFWWTDENHQNISSTPIQTIPLFRIFNQIIFHLEYYLARGPIFFFFYLNI